MFSLTGYYKRSQGLRLRPVPEMSFCLAYTPRHPNLYTLNPSAWLVVELCDGRIGKKIARDYRDAINAEMPILEAIAELSKLVDDLMQKRIVRAYSASKEGKGRVPRSHCTASKSAVARKP